MKKEYSVERSSVVDLLQDLDDFETKMIKFISKYPRYDYSISIKSEGNAWIGEVKIEKHEEITAT